MWAHSVLALACLSLASADDILVSDPAGIQEAVSAHRVGNAILLKDQQYDIKAQVRLETGMNITGPGFQTPAHLVLGDQANIPFVSSVPFRFAVDYIDFEDSKGHRCNTTESMAQQLSKFNLTSGTKHEILTDNRVSLHLDLGPWVNRRQIQDILVGECSYKSSRQDDTVFESIMMALDGTNCHGFLAIVLDMDKFASCNIKKNNVNNKELHVFDIEVKAEDTLVQVSPDMALADPLTQRSRGVAEVAVSEDDQLGFRNLLAFRWKRSTQHRVLTRLQGYWRSVGLYDTESPEAQSFGSSYPSVGITLNAQSTYTDGLVVRANLRTMMIGPHSLAMELGGMYKIESDGTENEVGEWIVEQTCPDQSVGSRCDQTITTVLRGCDITGNYVLKGLIINCDKNLDENCPSPTNNAEGDLDVVLTVQGKDLCVLKSEADLRPYTLGGVQGERAGRNVYKINEVVRRTVPIKSTAFHEVVSAKISNVTRTGVNTRTCIPEYFANPGLFNQGFNDLDESVEFNYVASSQFACATPGLGKSEMQVNFNLLVEYTDKRVGGSGRRRRRQTTIADDIALGDSIEITYSDDQIDPMYLVAADNFEETGEVNKVVVTQDESGNFTVTEQTIIHKGNYDTYFIIGIVIAAILCCLICICLSLIAGYVWKTKRDDEKKNILHNTGGEAFDRRGSVDTLQNYMGGHNSSADMFASRMGSMYSQSGLDNAFASRAGSMYSAAPSFDNRMSMYSRNNMSQTDGSQNFMDSRASMYGTDQSYMGQSEIDRSSGYYSGIPDGDRQYFDDGQGPYYVDENGNEVYEDPGAEYYDPNAQDQYYNQGQQMYDDQGQPMYDDQGQPMYESNLEPMYDDQGQQMYDDQGQPMYAEPMRPMYDDLGQQMYDDQGQPMYEDQYQQNPFDQDDYNQSNSGFSQGQYSGQESYDMEEYPQQGQFDQGHNDMYDTQSNGAYNQESYEMTNQPEHYQAGEVYEHSSNGIPEEGEFPDFNSERDGESPLNTSEIDYSRL